MTIAARFLEAMYKVTHGLGAADRYHALQRRARREARARQRPTQNGRREMERRRRQRQYACVTALVEGTDASQRGCA